MFLVNHLYAGTSKFSRKADLLRKDGMQIDNNVRIVGPVFSTASISIGEGTWIGRFFRTEGNGEVIIGKNCDIGPGVTILTGTHEIGDESRRAGEGINKTTRIGDGTWIGANATILPGVTIGKGNMIGAGSVVTRSTDDNVLVAGNPAAVKRVFDNEDPIN